MTVIHYKNDVMITTDMVPTDTGHTTWEVSVAVNDLVIGRASAWEVAGELNADAMEDLVRDALHDAMSTIVRLSGATLPEASEVDINGDF